MRIFLFLGLTVLTSGCTGLGSGSFLSSATESFSGTASAGPVNGATITVRAINADGSLGATLATATTDGSGNFTVQMSPQTSPVAVIASGGNYVEEASSLPISLGGSQMRTVLSNLTSGQSIGVTPVTEIATQNALASIANNQSVAAAAIIANANAMVGSSVGITDITAPPANPNLPASSASSTQAAQYAVVLASISQLAATASGSVGTPLSSLDIMQAFATSFTYNNSFTTSVGASTVPVPNAGNSSVTLTQVLNASGGAGASFNGAMTAAMNMYLGSSTNFTPSQSVSFNPPQPLSGAPNLTPPTPPSSLPSTEPPAPTNSAPFNGTFTGIEIGTIGGQPYGLGVTINLTQNGTAVSGTFSNSGDSSGTLTAVASGNSLTSVTITQPISTGLSCSVTGAASLSSTGTLTGSLSLPASGSCPALVANINLNLQGSQAAQSQPFSGSFLGTEVGTEGSGKFGQTMHLFLLQNGNSFTGFYDGTGRAGPVTGTISGMSITSMTIAESDPSCSKTLSGTATLNSAGLLSGSLTGPSSSSCGVYSSQFTSAKWKMPNSAAAIPFTGLFVGSVSGTKGGTSFTNTVNVILTQIGSQVSGVYSSSDNSAGTITATASGGSLSNITMSTQLSGSCWSTVVGSSRSLASGNLSGSLNAAASGSCGDYSANFTWDLQSPAVEHGIGE